MIQSMTGFGKAVVELPHKKITVEIKSLNSKQLDLSTRIPQQYREMEMEIRFKKCGISNQPNVCIFDDPCLSKFGALRGSCPHPGRQFVGLLCVSLMAPLNKT